MSSPDPMVSEAMIAPGPKMVSHDAGFRDYTPRVSQRR